MIILELFNKMKRLIKLKEKPYMKTKGHKLLGKVATVSEDINIKNGTGRVDIGHSWWIALSENMDDIINKGSRVKIVDVKGYKLIVSRC